MSEFYKGRGEHSVNQLEAMVEALKSELSAKDAENEVFARFGEFLKTDMSNCYDAKDAVDLWKNRVRELWQLQKDMAQIVQENGELRIELESLKAKLAYAIAGLNAIATTISGESQPALTAAIKMHQSAVTTLAQINVELQSSGKG